MVVVFRKSEEGPSSRSVPLGFFGSSTPRRPAAPKVDVSPEPVAEPAAPPEARPESRHLPVEYIGNARGRRQASRVTGRGIAPPTNLAIAEALTKVRAKDGGPLGVSRYTGLAPDRLRVDDDADAITDLYKPGANQPVVLGATLNRVATAPGVFNLNPTMDTSIAGIQSANGDEIAPEINGNLVRVLRHHLHVESDGTTARLKHIDAPGAARVEALFPRLGPFGVHQARQEIEDSRTGAEGDQSGTSRMVLMPSENGFKFVRGLPPVVPGTDDFRDNGILHPAHTLGVPLFAGVAQGANNISGTKTSVTGKPQRDVYSTKPFLEEAQEVLSIIKAKTIELEKPTTTASERERLQAEITKLHSARQLMLNPDVAAGFRDALFAGSNQLGRRYIGLAPGVFGGPSSPQEWNSAEERKAAYATIESSRSMLSRGMHNGLFPFLHEDGMKRIFAKQSVDIDGKPAVNSEFFDVVGTRATLEVPVLPNTSHAPDAMKTHIVNASRLFAPIRATMDDSVLFLNPNDEQKGEYKPAYVVMTINSRSTSGKTTSLRILDDPRLRYRASTLASGLQSFSHWGVALTDQGAGHSRAITYWSQKLAETTRKLILQKGTSAQYDVFADPEIIEINKKLNAAKAAQIKTDTEVARRKDGKRPRGFKESIGTKENPIQLPMAGYGGLSSTPVPILDPKTEISGQLYAFNPLVPGQSISAISMHPSSVDNVTGLTESPWYRLQTDRKLTPSKDSEKLSQEVLSQESLAQSGLRALVISQGVDGYAMVLKSPDGHVIQAHGFQWSPAVLAVHPPIFRDKSGTTLPSGSLFGAAISNTVETFNRSVEEYGHIRRIQSQIIYDDDDKETEQADILGKAIEKREDPFALYRETPLWSPVFDKNGDPIPGQFEQSPNHNSLTMSDPGHYALDDFGVWRFFSGISSDTAMEYGIHNFPTKMMRGGVNHDAFYPHDVGGKSRWNRKTTRTTGVDESWPDRGGDSGWAVPGQRFSYDRFNGTPERYVLTGDAVRQYQIANPERRALSDRISREIYDLQMQRHSMASGRYTVIAQRERTKSTRKLGKYSEDTKKDWETVATKWATTTFMENIPTISSAENDPNRNSMPVAEFLAEGIKTFLCQDQQFIHHFSQNIEKPEIQEAIASVLCQKFGVASLEDLDAQTKELINTTMKEATSNATTIREKEEKDKDNEIEDLVITDLHGQDIVTGSYRLFSRPAKGAVHMPCALMDNDDKETILFFPRDPEDKNNLFLGMRAGNRIEWVDGKKVISNAIPENRGDHNSPIFIKSVSVTPNGSYCTLSKSQEMFSDELKAHIEQYNPTKTKTDGSLLVRISQDELVPILPSQIRPYDGFIEQHGEELPSSLFTNMLLSKKQRESAEKENNNETIREEIIRYLNNVATKRDPLQASGVDANGNIIPNERSGFLRKIGIDIGVEDSHYMFASMNPDDYTWIKESIPETIDLQDPMYYLASRITPNTTGSFNAIRKSRQSADQQDYNIQLWSLNNMQKVARALVVKRADAINGKYDVKSLVVPSKYTDDEDQEITLEADDDYKKIMQEDDDIPIEHLKDPNQAMQTLILALEMDAFRSITPHGKGGYDEKGNADSDGEYDEHGNHILEFIEIPKEITDISQNSAMKQFKDAYGYAISDQYIKLIGMNGLLSELLNSRNEETLSDLKSVHPEIGAMFEKALNISDRYAKTNDKEEKSRLRTEGLEISQDIVYAQMSDVFKRIKGYSALSPLQKLAFVELDNVGIVGNFNKLRMGVPKSSYQLDGTDVSDEQCQEAALVIHGLASSSVAGNHMANNKGLYRSDGTQKIEIMQHQINPDAFQAVFIKGKLTHVRALDYPEIDPKIRDLAKLSEQVAFKGNPSEAKLDEMIKIIADYPECQAELIKAKNTFMDRGELSRTDRLKIIQTVGVRLGLSPEDLPYGMLKNIKDNITTAMALTVASQAQMHAMWTHRKQEDQLTAGQEKPIKRPGLGVTLNALPLGLSGEHQALADHGHSDGSKIFDGTVPSVLPRPIHDNEQFLPADEEEKNLGRKTIALQDGRNFTKELLMPARLPQRRIVNGQIVNQLDAQSVFENLSASGVTVSLPTIDYENDIRTSPAAIRASMAGYASPRWSMLMLLGDDDEENSLIKKYLHVPQGVSAAQGGIGQKIWDRLIGGKALNGILVAGNIGLGKDEDVVNPVTKEKLMGSKRPLRIDGLDNELGRARTTSGVYLSFDPSPDNITYDEDKKQVTINQAVFTQVNKSRQGSFSRERKMNAPLVISWQVDNGQTKINMSDIRKKLYFFTQIIDDDTQQFVSDSQERLAIDKTGLATDIISIMPSHVERLMGIAKTESDRRIGVGIASFEDLFDEQHHALASAFRAMWEAPTSFDSIPGVAGAQRQKAIYDATGWTVSGPDQIKDAFLSPSFAAASSSSTWGTRGIVVGRTGHKDEGSNNDLAIVFVPMKPSEAVWFDATDHEDRAAKIREERLADQSEAMGHFRSLFHSIMTGSSHDPQKTVHEEKKKSPFWLYGKRWNISSSTEDGARFGRPFAAGPEAAALKAARTINAATKNPMTLGRFVLMRIDRNELNQIRNQDGTPSDALWVSLGDSTAAEHRNLLSDVTEKRNEYNRALTAAGISEVPRMSQIRTFSLESLSEQQQKILRARKAYEEWRSAKATLAAKSIQAHDEENLIIANPEKDIVASWDPKMTLTHESVAKMAPYMAYWLTQVAQLQGDSADIHYGKALDEIAKKRGLSEESKSIIDKLKSGILEKAETTQIAQGKQDLLPERHIPETMHKKSSEEWGIVEIPDFMLVPDHKILDRKVGFSTEKMIQVIDQLPIGLRNLISEKIQLAIISHNGASHEFPSIIDRTTPEPVYTWRDGNVIYASTIGIDPQNDFLNNLADIFAGEIWFPEEGKDRPEEKQTNIFGQSKNESYEKSKEYADAVVKYARSIRQQDNFDQMQPISRKWIESIIQWHENAMEQADEKVTQLYPGINEEDKESYMRNYALSKVALNLHREWFKAVVTRGGPVERFVRDNRTRTSQPKTQYNGTPSWIDAHEIDSGAMPVKFLPYYLLSQAKASLNQGKPPEQWEGWDTIARPQMKSLLRGEEELRPLIEKREQLDSEQKASALYGLETALTLDSTDNRYTGALAITAFAGTGKTRTIVHRVSELVNLGFNPKEFFIASFTRKSSQDLRDKINKNLIETGFGETSQGVTKVAEGFEFNAQQVHTWHGHALFMLRNDIPVPSELLSPGQQKSGQQLIDLYTTEVYDKASKTIIHYKNEFYTADNIRVIDDQRPEDKNLLMRLMRRSFRDLKLPTSTVKNGKRVSRLDDFRSFIDQVKSLGITPAQYEQQLDIAGETDIQTRHFSKVYARYQALMAEQGLVDQTDLLNMVVSILKRNPTVLSMYQQKYRQFIVDEYQDQNGAQEQLLQLLSDKKKGGSGNVTVVGDPRQAIYGWRGSTPQYLKDFADNYKYTNSKGETIVPGMMTIKTNYRSTEEIVDVGNTIRGTDESGFSHAKMQANPAALKGSPVEIVACDDENSQANFIADEIKRLVGKNHSDTMTPKMASSVDESLSTPAYGDMMVVTRLLYQARTLQRELQSRGIPATIDHGESSVSSSRERTMSVPQIIRGLLESSNEKDSAHLNELADIFSLAKDALSNNASYGSLPETSQNGKISVLTTIARLLKRNNSTLRYDQMNKLLAAYDVTMENAQTRNEKVSLMRFILDNQEEKRFFTAAQWRSLSPVAESIEANNDGEGRSLSKILMHAIGETSLFGKKLRNIASKSIINKTFDSTEVRKFLADLNFENLSVGQIQRKIDNLENRLNQISDKRVDDQELAQKKIRQTGNAVRILTIHVAKGTEARVVFNAYWNEGSIPIARSENRGPESRQEERNLAYVSSTRAKERNYFVYPKKTITKAKSVRSVNPSRFIGEIPEKNSNYSEYENGIRTYKRHPSTDLGQQIEQIVQDPSMLLESFGIEPTKDLENLVDKLRRMWAEPQESTAPSGGSFRQVLFDGVPFQSQFTINPWGSLPQANSGNVLNGQYAGETGAGSTGNVTRVRNVRGTGTPEPEETATSRAMDILTGRVKATATKARVAPAPAVNIIKAIKGSILDDWHAVISSGEEPDVPDAIDLIIKYLSKKPRDQKTIRQLFDLPSYTMPSDEELGVGEWSTDKEYWDAVLQDAAPNNNEEMQKKIDEIIEQLTKEKGESASPRLV
ncbi:ATP-dependent helicase [bacterium]|nr:ATP-dependent helicase [bacterium]NBT60165.1 ATP-dependent helicase [Planctomycetia bacterium]